MTTFDYTREVATRDSWQDLKRMPEDKTRLDFSMAITLEECRRLLYGFVPQCMEEHWFIYHENGWLHFYRSWTGYCIYQARIQDVGNKYEIVEAWASRDERQYKETNDKYDSALLQFLINKLIGKDVPFPTHDDLLEGNHLQAPSIQVNADSLISFAKTLEGQEIQTRKHKRQFTVQVTNAGMEFTPYSGTPRKEGNEAINRICKQFNENNSFKTQEYKYSMNASYVLALIGMYVNR